MNKILSKAHVSGKIQIFKRTVGSLYILYFYVQPTPVRNLKSYRLNFIKSQDLIRRAKTRLNIIKKEKKHMKILEKITLILYSNLILILAILQFSYMKGQSIWVE